MEIPVLKIGPILMVSIQTELHDHTAEELQETLLRKIQTTDAEGVLIDISSLEMVDSFIGRVLNETALMAAIMDAKVAMVGMRPAVTMTLLEMGLDLKDIDTAIDVEAGFEMLGYRVEKVTSSADSDRAAEEPIEAFIHDLD